jgi:HIP---CoA ligase
MFEFKEVVHRTTPAVLAELATVVPATEGIVAPDGRTDYAGLAARCASLAEGFRRLGLAPGDRVGVLLPNGLRWCLTVLAAHAAGLSVVPLNTWSRSSELAFPVHRTGLRLIVADRVIFGHDFVKELDALGLHGRSRSFLGCLWWPADAAAPEGLDVPPPGYAPDLLATAPTEASEAFVLFTSGSTSQPKAVPLHQGKLVRNARAIGDRHHLGPGDRIWFASPLFFVFGCANALPSALTHGITLCLQDRFDAVEALRFIEQERCTIYYGVSTMTQALAACPTLGDHDISALRTGSTALAPGEDRLATEVLGITQICNVYGLTEGYSHTTMPDADDPPEIRLVSQGRVLPTQELRVLRPDGSEAAPGEAGDVVIRGCVTDGYIDAPQLNAQSFDEDGWFSTGDIALLDEGGNFHFVSRGDDMFKVNGINISPSEVEELLIGHPDIDEVYAFGVPEGNGKVLCSVLVVRDGAERRPSVPDVVQWLQARAASYKVPKRIEVMDPGDLPVTATGKVSRRLLAERLERD